MSFLQETFILDANVAQKALNILNMHGFMQLEGYVSQKNHVCVPNILRTIASMNHT